MFCHCLNSNPTEDTFEYQGIKVKILVCENCKLEINNIEEEILKDEENTSVDFCINKSNRLTKKILKKVRKLND